MLSNAIQEAGNVVLVTKVLQADTLLPADVSIPLDVLIHCLQTHAIREGYANLDTDAAFQDDVKTCRLFNPKIEIKGKPHYAFAVEMAMEYDSVKTQEISAAKQLLGSYQLSGVTFTIFSDQRIIPKCFTRSMSIRVRTGKFCS